MKLFKSHIYRDINNHPKAKLMLLGGVLFSLGLVTSVATTYAWFQINPLLTIDHLNLRIDFDASYELNVKLFSEEKQAVIGPDDPEHQDTDGNFTGYTLKDMGFDPEKDKLFDVSGMFWEDWYQDGNPSDTLPTFRSSYGSFPGEKSHYTKSDEASVEKYRDKDGNEQGKGYLQAVFYLEANADCDIYLTPNSGVKSADTDETAFEKGKSLEDLQKVTNTVRFSFYSDDGYVLLKQPRGAVYKEDGKLQSNHEDLSDDDITYYGGLLDMNGDGFYDCDKDGKEVLYGQYDGTVPYTDNKPIDKEVLVYNTFDAKHPLEENGATKWVNMNDVKTSGMIKKEPAASIFEYIYDNDKPYRPLQSICHLKPGDEKRLVFSVYCEGWDTCMTDLVSLASFNIFLGFTAVIRD